MLTIDATEYLSPVEAAEQAGVSLATLWRWLRVGIRGRVLPSIHVGGRRFISVADLEDFTAPVPVVAPAQTKPRKAAGHVTMRKLRR